MSFLATTPFLTLNISVSSSPTGPGISPPSSFNREGGYHLPTWPSNLLNPKVPPSSVELPSLLLLIVVLICFKSGLSTGTHCTIIVPVTSDEYQILDMALFQKYHSSFRFPSYFHSVRIADAIATIRPKDMVRQSPIFSLRRMSRFQVIIQGKAANTKSITTLTSVSSKVSDGTHPGNSDDAALTVAAFLESGAWF